MMPTTDFEAVFRESPYPYVVLSKDYVIMSANKAYLKIVGRVEADIVGQNLFDAFPENPNDPTSTNTQQLKNSINAAISTRRPHVTDLIRYAIPVQTDEGSGFIDRYWTAIHTPAFDANGEVAFVFQNTIDVTDFYDFDATSDSLLPSLKPKPAVGAGMFNRAQMHQAITRVLNDERGHLRNIFNQSPGFVALLTGPDHVFEMMNEAHYRLLGHREVIGKSVLEAVPEVAGQGYLEILDQVYTTGQPWSARGIKTLIQPNPQLPAKTHYLDMSYQPFHDEQGNVIGIFSHGYDVTDTFAANALRLESEERLKEGMLAAKMVVWDWDIDSERIGFSENAMDVLGTDSQMISSIWACIHPDDLLAMKALQHQAILEKSAYQSLIRYTRPDNGEQIWLDVRGKIRCDEHDEACSVRGITLDVSERMRAEHELRLAGQRKDEFLAMLAHELRNPLAPISAAAQIMKLKKLDEEQIKRTGDIIARQIHHLTGLVDDLIDVSRVTRGLINIDKRLLDVKKVISEAIEQTKPLIETKQHDLLIDLPDRHIEVWGDHTRLVQVIANVLSNSAKYTPGGGQIALRMHVRMNHIVIEVKDNGIGISNELLPHIFELFSQAERTSARSQGGLGIGLALVKSLITLHDGHVSVASSGIGKGSVFTIQLPVALGDELPSELIHEIEDAEKADDELTVMVVDDNVDAAQTLGMLLEAMGYKLMLAYSARSAIEQSKTKLPDVFILDIGLPDMDGNELARHFSSQPLSRHVPLIALTGYGQEEDRHKTKRSGFTHHFVKPVDANALLDVIAGIQQAKMNQ